MLIRPFLMLYRLRIGLCAGLAVLMALLMLFITSAESPTDFGVLWHHFCGCAPDTSDVHLLLWLSTVTGLGIGGILGLGVGAMGGAQASRGATVPGMVYGEMRFLLTRPMRRAEVLLVPITMAVVVMVLFPAAGLLVLLGWLRLVHAPALGHLVDIARLVPGAEGMGQHPSLMTVLAATHFARHYAASVSVGLCIFAVYYAQRWWPHSANKWIRWASILPMLVPVLPAFLMRARGALSAILITNGDLTVLPSVPLIGVHLLFVVAMLWSCWRIAERVEV